MPEIIIGLISSVGFPIVVWWFVNKQMVELQNALIEMQAEQAKADKEVAVAINNNTNAIVKLTDYIKEQMRYDNVEK